MTKDEVRETVAEVLAEQARKAFETGETGLDPVTLKTIATLLTSFGIEEDDRLELKADFSHLRRWRKSVEQAQSYTFKAVITVIVGGVIGAFWLGFKSMVGK
jgi:hypothetical protein